MSAEASFMTEVTFEDARRFAELSGDWNPLHTDRDYARSSEFGRPILHGAFSAGLISRLAGMHLPGTECLLHSINLRFVAAILPPAQLVVRGRIVSTHGEGGKVNATVTDASSGVCYVEAAYEFSRHTRVATPVRDSVRPATTEDAVLVTGASGGLGQALLSRLGGAALGVARSAAPGVLQVEDPERIADAVGDRKLSAIVHCAWPAPDNVRLLDMRDSAAAVEHYIAKPVRQILSLAQLLADRGTPDAILVLIGSTADRPGRHNYRMPLYGLGKALVPDLCQILAVELGQTGRRTAALVFDVIEAGMNKRLSPRARLAHVDRSPAGRLPDADQAAAQIEWLLQNRSFLVSGATITLAGGAMP